MIRVVLIAALVAAAFAMPIQEEDHLFNSWKAQFNKIYDAEEEAIRKVVFFENLEKAQALNKVEPGVYGMTQFADLTEEEFSMYLGFRPEMEPSNATVAADLSVEDTPTAWDWREKGAVTEVKNQGQCGSCWAFSTTGDIEGTWFLAGNKLTELSEQDLVDCDKNGDQGCNGGLPSNAFQYIISAGGIESESDYPYKGVDGSCSFSKSKAAAKISSWEKVSTDEDQIAAYLAANGPLSIGINAGPMQLYMGGIADPFLCSPKHLDHGVLIVGFGEENGKKFWIIKNSWGTGWGEKGYYRIIRGKGKCGLNTMVTHSKV